MKKETFEPSSILEALMALAVERAARRRNRKRSFREIETWRKSWHKRRRKAAREASARREAAQRDVTRKRFYERRPARNRATPDRMVRAMQPGAWYGARDIVRLVGAPRNANSAVLQRLLPAGFIERAANPAWCGMLPPHRIQAGEVQEPQWVFRLTAKGEARRAELQLLGY